MHIKYLIKGCSPLPLPRHTDTGDNPRLHDCYAEPCVPLHSHPQRMQCEDAARIHATAAARLLHGRCTAAGHGYSLRVYTEQILYSPSFLETRSSPWPDNRALIRPFFFSPKKAEVASEGRTILKEKTRYQGKIAEWCLKTTCGVELLIKEQLLKANACPLDLLLLRHYWPNTNLTWIVCARPWCVSQYWLTLGVYW